VSGEEIGDLAKVARTLEQRATGKILSSIATALGGEVYSITHRPEDGGAA